MGDKSPKSAQKKAGQKQHKADDARAKKKAAADAKHVLPTTKKK